MFKKSEISKTIKQLKLSFKQAKASKGLDMRPEDYFDEKMWEKLAIGELNAILAIKTARVFGESNE